MIKVHISGNRADVIDREPLTSGTVGKVINFAFTEDWRPLIKYAVFEGSGRRIALTNIGDSCIIPHEVLAKHGGALRVGVYGRTADGSAATPTVYAQLGIIQRGADPNADPSTKPTLPVWAQIQAQIGDMSALETEAKDSLVAAINEAAKSGGGGSGGKDGTGIESITYKGEDESGGNMYTVLLTDGTSYDITAPKGAKGDKGDAAPIDKTLTQEGQAADSKAVGDAINSLSEEKVSLPKDDTGSIQNGTNGQILQTNGDGTTQWVDKSTGGSSASSGSTINQYFYNSLASGKYDMKDGYGTTADIYIAADGTETAISGLGYVATDYIPVSANTTYMAYCNGYALYDREKTFVSAVIDRSNYGTIMEFTPEQDGYVRVTYRGSAFSRLCEKSEIKKAPRDYMPAPSPFFDTRIPCNVGLYGDSNSYGYGLSDRANAWSNRLGALLLSMPKKITNGARYEMSVFADSYNRDPKLRNNGVVYMSAYTDKFIVNGEYITAVDVYIDGVQQEQMTASPAEYTCPLGYHEIKLRGSTGSNNVIKSIATNKTRSFTNHAVTGIGSGKLPNTVDGNVEIVMYGTNDRGTAYGATADNMARFYRACEAAGAKVYFLSPIPTKVEGETDTSYVQTISDVISQIPDINYIDVYKDMQLYSRLSTETLYSDKLHLNDLGHKVLFCIVASKLHLAALNSIFDE